MEHPHVKFSAKDFFIEYEAEHGYPPTEEEWLQSLEQIDPDDIDNGIEPMEQNNDRK